MSGYGSARCCVIDPVCFKPYDVQTMAEEGVAGTEATVVRLAEELNWSVLQHNRKTANGRYQPLNRQVQCPTIIVLRNPSVAVEMARQNASSRVILWFHDLHPFGSSRAIELLRQLPELRRHGILLVAVSDFLKHQLNTIIKTSGSNTPAVTRIYNPVVVPELPPMPVDEDKMIFFSSPHKGIETAIKVFSGLRRKFKKLQLIVANPGYFPSYNCGLDRIIVLGQRPHKEVLPHVKSSLCTLFPNYVYPETFGLVLAESNAVGTPVLTHDIGAAAEVLNDERQIIAIPRGRMRLDALQRKVPWAESGLEYIYSTLGGYESFIDRISAWREGKRPTVGLRPEFMLAKISEEWRNLIESHT